MPFGNAGTLTDDEVYGIVAYILYSNDLIDEDFVLSNETFAEVEMYNDGGFIVDDRPETESSLAPRNERRLIPRASPTLLDLHHQWIRSL